jgi:hypothetical protein
MWANSRLSVLKMVVRIRNNHSAQRFQSVKGCNCFQRTNGYVNRDYELTFAARYRINSRGQKWREYCNVDGQSDVFAVPGHARPGRDVLVAAQESQVTSPVATQRSVNTLPR